MMERAEGRHPRVSVIVTFYNLEDCVEYCLDSIMAQTFGDFEVVCIDDGSSDGTPALLDEYALKDPRIVVHHFKNGGLSAARNRGVARACGDFVTFVDGDDVVSPRYLTTLLDVADQTGTDFVVSRLRNVSQEDVRGGKFSWKTTGMSPTILEGGEIATAILYNEITESPCGRLAPRRVYEGEFFPVGRLYEDLASIAKFVDATERLALVEDEIYGYVKRDNSIVNVKRVDPKQVKDYLRAVEELVDWASHRRDVPRSALAFRRLLVASRIRSLLVRIPEDSTRRVLWKRVRGTLEGELRVVLTDDRTPRIAKVRFVLLRGAPFLHDALLNRCGRRGFSMEHRTGDAA